MYTCAHACRVGCMSTCAHARGVQHLVLSVFLNYLSSFLFAFVFPFKQDRSLNLELTDWRG